MLTNKLSLLVAKIGGIFIAISRKIYMNPHVIRVMNFKHSTDPLILTTFNNINENSIVLDVGGYHGQWSSDIFSCYQPTIHIFEPVSKYVQFIKNRFHANKKIIIHPIGLDGCNKEAKISILDDGSSTHKASARIEKIKLKKISSFLDKQNIKEIDLMKINIEGGEYRLLEDLINNNKIKQVRQLLIQFHDFASDAKERMGKIHTQLKKTHKPVFKYEFVWEHWKLNC